MNEHITDLLGPYLDGELGNSRQRQVEEHLAKCAACRKQLEELRDLSTLLQESVPAEAFTSTDRFVSNLALKLPRRPEATPVSKAVEFLWWLVPAGVLGAWVLLQMVFTVRTLVSTASLTGLLGNSVAWLGNGPQNAAWFSASMSLFGSHLSGSGRTILDVLNSLSIFVSSLTMQLVWQAGLALVFWAWLAFWWTHRRAVAAARLPQTPSHS